MSWWRRLWRWFYKSHRPRFAKKFGACALDHKKDHMCWDDIMEAEIGWRPPGYECWFCNKCKRSWHVHGVERAPHTPEPVVWGELWASSAPGKPGQVVFLGPMPEYVKKAIDERRKNKQEVENARSSD